MQAEKKNPSDPDAVVTADAGAVWVDGVLQSIQSLCSGAHPFHHHDWGL